MDNWWLYLIIGVILVGMILLTIIPQKKRQKQQQEMMNSLTVGTKIMTIGRLVGVIVQVNADNTLHVNVGTEAQPTVIVIDRPPLPQSPSCPSPLPQRRTRQRRPSLRKRTPRRPEPPPKKKRRTDISKA